MEIVDRPRHEKCIHFDTSEQPLVEILSASAGQTGDFPIRINEIIFLLEGELHFIFSDSLEHNVTKGHMVLLPSGGRYHYETLEKTVVLVFRIAKPIEICQCLSLEKFYKSYRPEKQDEPHFSTLKINPRIWYFLEGVAHCLSDGVKCRNYANIVIKEFMLMLSIYYSKEEIYDFLFYLTLSEDVIFSEHVRRQWHLYKNVEDIAESMWMTPRKFSAKFKEVFSQTPYNWMKANRAKLIQKELLTTNKLIKQIAAEQGFDNKSQFTKFCKKELGASPTELRASRAKHQS